MGGQGWGKDMGGMGGGWEIAKQGGGGERYVVSKSTNTKTQTCNGVTKVTKVTKIKYSDGTEEEKTEETITQ